MTLIEGLRSSPGLLLFACVLLGLAVGSFLNVVAYRLPLMMHRAWWREARDILRLPPRPEATPLTLSQPASRCPACGAAIAAHHNVPVLGWLWLRGRCAACKARISPQYPLVEAISGVLSAVCALHFGWGPQLLPALLLTWALLALTLIDLHTTLLPDDITLPLLWLGLALSLVPVFADMRSAVLGAIFGYLLLWLIYHLFRLATGKEGMGYGDFKLLAALGAWLGWQSLPQVILMSSACGAVVGLGLILLRRKGRESPIPFGPFLAAAGWITLLWGERIPLLSMAAAGG
ncbi:MAG TPA: A24 family peptidase [Solimonas sp.]|nr:A24 family peptidase [Solimonas sp.]